MIINDDYFNLGHLYTWIFAFIPFTSWILGMIVRFKEGKIIAGLLRFFFGFNILWIADLISLSIKWKIVRLINF